MMRRVLLMILVCPAVVQANPYFNSPAENCNVSSGTCAAHPDWVLADDFDDGNWYATGNDSALSNPANDGWFGCNDANPATTCRTPDPPAVSPNGSGFGGTGYAAMSSPQGGNGGDSALGMHGFYPNDAEYTELYWRFYIKFLPGYTFNNNQKFISLIQNNLSGGIDYGGMFTHDLSQIQASPQFDCTCANDANSYTNPQNTNGGNCYLRWNIGSRPTLENNHWWYVEMHVKMNTYGVRDGLWEVWAHDCGAGGTSCTGTPTKVANYTNVGWRGNQLCATPNGGIGSAWYDIWGNPGDQGDLYFDNLVIATSGPIGFAGAGGGGGGGSTAGGGLDF